MTRNKRYRYFKSPDFIFDLNLSAYALLVMFNLLRRSNQHGQSYPSVKRICRDTGIASPTSVHKALKELTEKDFINKIPRSGESTIYNITPSFFTEIERLEKLHFHYKGNGTSPRDGEVGSSFNSEVPIQDMVTKEEKNKENKTLKENEQQHNYPTNSRNKQKSSIKEIFKKSKIRDKKFISPNIKIKHKLLDEMTEWEVNQAEERLDRFTLKNKNERPELYD